MLFFAADLWSAPQLPNEQTRGASGTVVVHAHAGHAIPATFYGLMTEEINHAYDGGLYAELIRNRAFKDSDQPVGWQLHGDGATGVLEPGKVPAFRVSSGPSGAELTNSGFWGIPVRPNTTYQARLRLRSVGRGTLQLTAGLAKSDGSTVFAERRLALSGKSWQLLRFTLKTGMLNSTADSRFFMKLEGEASLEINYASLFPPTFHGRANGLRTDLMKLQVGLHPAFLRLPGWNYLEGDTIATRFAWKTTLGDPMERDGHQGPWGYRSSDGIGLPDFLHWCDDLHMQPLLAVYAGYSLRGEHVHPGPGLQPFVEEALDEIEYVSGAQTTRWGRQRALDGHPKPAPLTFVEVGNEDWFDRSGSYDGRFAQFYDAIKQRYPRIQIIATTPVKSRVPDLLDDHFYRSAQEMERDAAHYDLSSRSGPKIFVGEWASTEGRPTPTFQAALGDAAWLTGLERNSDLVAMEAYAPLLVNVNQGAAQWGTNLIGYDALSSFGSPSYYVQSMFAKFTGDATCDASVTVEEPAIVSSPPHGAVGLGTWRTQSEFKDLQVTPEGGKVNFGSGFRPWRPVRGTWVESQLVYHQTSLESGTLAIAGDPSWTNYTFHVKARKTGGGEGFLIAFHVRDERNFWQWNVGGWNNTRSRVQRVENGSSDEVGTESPATVETNRWYDLRIELNGTRIRCYLDGKLINEAEDAPRPPVKPIYVASSISKADGALFLKIVNVSDQDYTLQFNLEGRQGGQTLARGLLLQGKPEDQNSVGEPRKVAPKETEQQVSSNVFTRRFGAHTVTALTIPGR